MAELKLDTLEEIRAAIRSIKKGARVPYNGANQDVNLGDHAIYAGNGYFGDFDAGNYSEFEDDGTLEFHGDGTVWDDIILPLDPAKVPAANFPSWIAFVGNLNAWRFGIGDYLEMTAEIPHRYMNGGDLYFHVHWVSMSNAPGVRAVNWEIEYTIANAGAAIVGDVFPAPTIITQEDTIPAGTPTNTHAFTQVGIDATGNFNIGAVIKMRLRRIAAVGTAPGIAPFALGVGIHYPIDTVGSRNIRTK